MKYNSIKRMDISNGPGIRVSIFTQGCTHHCPGCFNSETWNFEGGKNFTSKEEDLIIELCKEEHCAGLSLLGGEPLLDRNFDALMHLLTRFHKECKGKTVWLWTGFTVEQLTKKQWDIVKLCNTVIDGPFIKEKKDLSLFYAGSTNQRIFDVIPLTGLLMERKMPTINGSKSSKSL